MKQPDLQMLAHWLDPVVVATLDARRRLKKEWQRQRKLATLQTLWLMLAVSLDTQRSSLHEILRLATGQLGFHFSVSVTAFCKARARFSPQLPIVVVWRISIAIANRLQPSAPPLAWFTSYCRRQDNSGVTGISSSLQALRRTQGPAGFRPDCRGSSAACLTWSVGHHCALSSTKSAPPNTNSSSSLSGRSKKVIYF